MGKLEDNSSINHFSHEHPLQLQNLQSQITNKATCLACNVSVSGSLFYTCYPCNFYLHKTCSNLPTTLKHKSDQSHALVLLSSPAYPEGVFKCNACGYHGRGFSYHCPDCQLDLHVVCASMPPSIDHEDHGHTLGLCFRPPYENLQGFSCDICKKPGSNHWLYRCDLCEFDAHMKCATARTTSRAVLPKSTSLPSRSAAPPPPIQIYYTPPPVQNPQVLMKSTSLPPHVNHHFSPPPPPPPPPLPPLVQPYYSQVPPAMGVQPYVQSPRQAGFINNMAGHAVEGFVGSVTQEIIQAVFEGATS